MRDVIGVLAQHGDLFFIDSRTNSASVGEQTAQEMGVPTAARNVFLDNRADVAYSEAQLSGGGAQSRKRTGKRDRDRSSATDHARRRARHDPALEAAGIQFVLVQDLVEPTRANRG